MSRQKKLTLSIDAGVIDSAKKYAAESGRSLSDIVENVLAGLVVPNSEPKRKSEKINAKFSPDLEKIRGVIKLPADFDHKKFKADRLSKKYL